MHTPQGDALTPDRGPAVLKALRLTALVAALFCLTATCLLAVLFIKARHLDFIDSGRLAALKVRLVDEPDNEDLKTEIRRLDLRLREDYFLYLRRSQRGVWLLLGGCIVLLAALKTASTHTASVPGPKGPSTAETYHARSSALTRWSAAVLGIGLGVTGYILITPDPHTYLDAALTQAADGAETVAPYPSPEEVAREWPRFRGPGGLGISAYTNIPTAWDGATGAGIAWQTEVPLSADNSPVVWGDRIFLTGATRTRREVYCFDRDSGVLLWTGRVVNVPGSTNAPEEIFEDTGYSASTAATDGRRVYAIFANGDVAASDFTGRQVWARNLGLPDNTYGHASSLLCYRDRLVVLWDQARSDDGAYRSKLIALDGPTGRTVWEQPREVEACWSTPIVITTPRGDQIVASSYPYVMGHAADSGRELWRVDIMEGDVAPSPVFGAGLVFAVMQSAYLTAIDPGGEGDVTKTHVVWKGEDGLPDLPSPLATDQYVVLLNSEGYMNCYDAKTGALLWDHDFETSCCASPSLAGTTLYILTTNKGETIMGTLGPAFAELGRAPLGEKVYSTPAFLDGRICIRGRKHLYMIDGTTPPRTPAGGAGEAGAARGGEAAGEQEPPGDDGA